jgi:hypothetical protein
MTKAELEKVIDLLKSLCRNEAQDNLVRDFESIAEKAGLLTGTCKTCIHATEPTESNHYCVPLQIPVHNDFYCADWQGVV